MKHFILIIAAWLTMAKVDPASASPLSLPDRSLVARSIVEQRAYMDVMLAAKDGQAASLADELKKRKFRIVHRADEVGYFRVEVPPRQVQSLASHPSVLAVGLGHFRVTALKQDKTQFTGDSPKKRKLTLPEFAKLAQSDPTYHAIEEMQVGRLRTESPSYDGRGVIIAIIEDAPDPFAPELSYAYDLQGRRIRKITDVYAFADLGPNSFMSGKYRGTGWVRLEAVSTESKRHYLPLKGRTIKMPAPGRYEIGFLDETDFLLYNRDLNSDGNPTSKPRTFAVARRPSGNCVWIDSDQDDDLTDEKCHTEYSKGGQGGFFRGSTGEPAGARFFIATSFRDGWIKVAIPNEHTHAVTAVAAGTPVLAPNLGSAAPAAQVLSIIVDTSPSTQIEAAIFAARQKSVDIIVNMYGSHLEFSPNNGIDTIILDRIAQRYGKIVVTSAGNNVHKISQIDSHGRGANVLAIGQYAGARASAAIRGSKYAGGPALGTSAGPAPDGRLKPDVMGVGLVVTPMPPHVTRLHADTCPNFEPASGYVCFGGTSSATPAATGAMAALISAARQKQLSFTPAEIVQAIRATARLHEGSSTHIQGRGLVDVYAAWQYLNRLVKNRESQVKIEVEAPVRTVLTATSIQPGTGPGLYEREGWSPGDKGLRMIKLRRTSGPDRPLKFSAAILGDYNQTFSAPKELILPLNQDVPVTVSIHPKQPGVHAAILRIADSASAIVAEDVSLAVIAAISLASADKQPLSLDLTPADQRAMNLYVNIPPETSALKVSHTGGGDIIVKFDGPLGERGGPLFDGADIFAKAPEISTDHYENTLYQPTHGVWEISLTSAGSVIPGGEDKLLPIRVNLTRLDGSQLQQAVAKVSSDGAFSSVGGLSLGFRSKIAPTAWKQGGFNLDQSSLPHIVPIDIPTGTRRIEIAAKANIPASAPASQETALLVSLLQCEATFCAYREGIAGSNKASLLFTPPPRGTLYAVIDGIANKERKGQATQIVYDVFVNSTDAPGNLDAPTSAVDRPLCRETAAETPGGFKLVDMKEIYSEEFFEGLYDVGVTAQYRLYNRTFIPLARLCDNPSGNRSEASG